MDTTAKSNMISQHLLQLSLSHTANTKAQHDLNCLKLAAYQVTQHWRTALCTNVAECTTTIFSSPPTERTCDYYRSPVNIVLQRAAEHTEVQGTTSIPRMSPESPLVPVTNMNTDFTPRQPWASQKISVISCTLSVCNLFNVKII